METDVIVVGAGAAGLAAALWLAERSLRVIVIDGRERIGGRVMWQTLGSVDVPAELGAEFIHGTAPQTSALLQAAGLSKVATGNAAWTAGTDGALVADDADAISGDIFERVQELAEDESVETFLRRFEPDPRTRAQAREARSFVEGFEAADPALASVRPIADEVQTGIDSASSRPVAGYAPLFEYVAAKCTAAGVDFLLGTTVERVEWQTGAVRVHAHDAQAGAIAVRARCAVITASVGVLQQRGNAVQLAFAPPLPARTRSALCGLEMGHAVRVVLAFRAPFWEQLAGGRYRDAAFFRCTQGAFQAYWTQMPLRSRTIVAWAGGPGATAMSDAPAAERIERARIGFGALLGEPDLARREFEAGVTHDWTADPLACGVYSYVRTGAGTARADLAAPVDSTLFFAGEATSTDGQGGTVSGAFETGTRAAREAHAALGVARPPSPIVF